MTGISRVVTAPVGSNRDWWQQWRDFAKLLLSRRGHFSWGRNLILKTSFVLIF